MKCQLCEENEQEWAVAVPLNEYIQPTFNKITKEGEYSYPLWLICNNCKESGEVEKTRKGMLNLEINCVVEEL